MCLNMQINALEVELDAKVISDLMDNTGSPNATNFAIVADCRALISQIPQVKVTHCYQEGNQCAEALARLGYSLSANIMYSNCPHTLLPPPHFSLFLSILDVFIFDLYRLSQSRLCPISNVISTFL